MGRALRISEVMQRMDVKDPDTVYRMIRDGRLPAVRVGRTWRVDSDNLERFMAGEDLAAEPAASAPAEQITPAKFRRELRLAPRRCRQ